MALVISVATHWQGYLPTLQRSCHQHGFEFDLLGLGKPWQGFGWRLELAVRRAIQEPDDKLIVFADAYDVVMCDSAARLQHMYKLARRPFVVGVYRYVKMLAGALAKHEFGLRSLPCGSRRTSPYQIPCAGVWVTTAGMVKRHLQPKLPFAPSLDDQRFLVDLLQRQPSLFYVDCGKHFVAHAFPESFTSLLTNPPSVAPSDELFVLPSGSLFHGAKRSFPVVLHGVGNTDLTPILQKMGHHDPHLFPASYVAAKLRYHLAESGRSVFRNAARNLAEVDNETFWVMTVLSLTMFIKARGD